MLLKARFISYYKTLVSHVRGNIDMFGGTNVTSS
jgi:hypothetical protein